MATILITLPVFEKELKAWKKNFPDFQFIHITEIDSFPQKIWDKIEVIFGSDFPSQISTVAPNLNWIHLPNYDLAPFLHLTNIEKENILVTYTKEENNQELTEFLFACILSFYKSLFFFKQSPFSSFDKKNLFTLSDKIFLQIGFNELGPNMLKKAKEFGMRTFGIKEKKTFHPFCEKTFSYQDLHSILPAVDIVFFCVSFWETSCPAFQKKEFELMKNNSIFLTTGPGKKIDFSSLSDPIFSKKFQGIVLDIPSPYPFAESNPFWKQENVLVTPYISTYPQKELREAKKNFTFNLRQYAKKNYGDMKNRVLKNLTV